MQRIVQKHSDGNYRRRANALLLLREGKSQREVQHLLRLSRTILRKLVRLYTEFGEAGLIPARPGAPERTIVENKPPSPPPARTRNAI